MLLITVEDTLPLIRSETLPRAPSSRPWFWPFCSGSGRPLPGLPGSGRFPPPSRSRPVSHGAAAAAAAESVQQKHHGLPSSTFLARPGALRRLPLSESKRPWKVNALDRFRASGQTQKHNYSRCWRRTPKRTPELPRKRQERWGTCVPSEGALPEGGSGQCGLTVIICFH